ncbi:TIGR00730 family Rossman fold protein [Chromobacterium sphagni]|uniref:Cytokinin riboside 5'-monophosphate phosphoribohydrolase n=1 Tax=Chromobacterium sphagni TaxID=1903179 RepID=A0A1S1WX37_9NEIS|nr:TIGR00730 family Rossman fold protein [Chromobacterium sphagni]OHX11762.1 Rossman fold protein, TIGR00730 family [Chromobacterium sphagni]OHX18905.1 Rossman fold protein, TIGR00730 family [Chromobacterium sphagni]
MSKIKAICLFCGSNKGAKPEYEAAARDFGRTLAEQGVTLVYGAGKVGLMGVAADAALAAGGRVVGVIPEFLKAKEVAHLGLSELHVTETMHQRKALMAELSDGFIALPGGFGTFDELFEILTWAQLSVHDKPVGVLDAAGFFQPLRALAQHAVAEGFVPPGNMDLFRIDASLQSILDWMRAYQPQPVAKWLELAKT